MSISREVSAFLEKLNRGTILGFRLKLTLLLTLIVSTATLLTLYFTQRTEQLAFQQSLEDRFQTRLGFLLGAQDAQEAEISSRCRQLTKVVRIQAALEEQDVEDLYTVAQIELRDVLDDGKPALPDQALRPSRATFVRFLTPDGKMLLPDPAQTRLTAWEQQLVDAGIGAGSQQIGYLAIQKAGGESQLNEIVSTPILGQKGELLGSLVLGFPPVDPTLKPDEELKTGLWLNGQLHMPALPAPEAEALSQGIARVIQNSPQGNNNFAVQLHGEPYLLFYKILNPGSKLAPAYEVCLYSLESSQADQQRLRWKIVAGAMVVLIVGLGASHAFSQRLSRPVEQLEEASVRNQARREEAEAALVMTEQKYQSIFENAVEGIFLLSVEGRYLSANPAMARMFGYDSAGGLMASSAKTYVDPAQREAFLRLAHEEGTVSNYECEMRRRDGTLIWISQNARAIRDASGQILHLEGTMEDITERKQAADVLQSLNAELAKALADLKATQNQIIQQERLRALGQMASGIAHDFNNALMPVTGFAELLLTHPAILDDKKKATGYLEMIRTAAGDAASIVARLREFYRSQAHQDVFTAIDLNHLARQAISLTQPKWKGQALASGAEIRVVEKWDNVPEISGEESALREVLTNLIFNAVDAMAQGGVLTLQTRREGERVVLELGDTGAGMTEEVRQRCLEPFFTTKGERGTGLGLSMVFGIVQRHGGEIDIRTRLGFGTTFLLRFPVRTKQAESATVAPASVAAPASLRILLVDDDAQVNDVLVAFLEIEGHQVCSVENGNDALKRFTTQPFDLVITDKAMPGLSGDQLAVEIKRLSPTTPVVLLSGFNSAGENEKVPGVDVIASKPITIPALREAIRKAMSP